jgi:hypothetical protein
VDALKFKKRRKIREQADEMRQALEKWLRIVVWMTGMHPTTMPTLISTIDASNTGAV